MNLFKRAIRIFLLASAAVGALVTLLAALFARRILSPPRRPLWSTPAELGLPFKNVQFPAHDDGIRLSGWFIPAEGEEKRPTILMVHGWPWQRQGEEPEGFIAKIMRTSSVDLLRAAKAIRDAGYHVLMFDLRNHGESASGGPVTFGFQEANDLLGAIDYAKSLPEVDADRIGTLGFSMGGNTVIYGLTQTQDIKAAVVVQPTSPAHFAPRLAADLAGPLGQAVTPLAEWFIRAGGGMGFSAVDPLYAAPNVGQTPILFVQGAGDDWGSIENVEAIAQAVPNAIDVVIATDATDRYSGYQYVIDNPSIAISFFDDYLV